MVRRMVAIDLGWRGFLGIDLSDFSVLSVFSILFVLSAASILGIFSFDLVRCKGVDF
jgi:thiol:disulfide interchange protein